MCLPESPYSKSTARAPHYRGVGVRLRQGRSGYDLSRRLEVVKCTDRMGHSKQNRGARIWGWIGVPLNTGLPFFGKNSHRFFVKKNSRQCIYRKKWGNDLQLFFFKNNRLPREEKMSTMFSKLIFGKSTGCFQNLKTKLPGEHKSSSMNELNISNSLA